MLQNGWRAQSIPVVLPCNRVRMANTLAFPSLSKICLEKAKALKRLGTLEQWCSERGWPVYLQPSTCSDNNPLPCSGLLPVHPKAPLSVFYMSYFKLFFLAFLKFWTGWKVGGISSKDMELLWRLSSAQRCEQVNIYIQVCMSPGDTSINFNSACVLWPKCYILALGCLRQPFPMQNQG